MVGSSILKVSNVARCRESFLIKCPAAIQEIVHSVALQMFVITTADGRAYVARDMNKAKGPETVRHLFYLSYLLTVFCRQCQLHACKVAVYTVSKHLHLYQVVGQHLRRLLIRRRLFPSQTRPLRSSPSQKNRKRLLLLSTSVFRLLHWV